jgi:predicted negative regulator of RcsB-dependent stress response
MDLTSIIAIVIVGVIVAFGFYVWRKKGKLKDGLNKETFDEFVEKASTSAKSKVSKK